MVHLVPQHNAAYNVRSELDSFFEEATAEYPCGRNGLKLLLITLVHKKNMEIRTATTKTTQVQTQLFQRSYPEVRILIEY